MKVKVVYGSDIRRWYAPNENQYEALLHFVRNTFKFPGDFFLQFEDDEGDRLTLSSLHDLRDALTVAHEEGRKSLKIYLIPTSIHAARQDSSSQFSGARSVSSFDSFDDARSESFEVVEEALEPPPEEVVPRTMEEEMTDFLSDKAVSAVLPDFVRAVMLLVRTQDVPLNVAMRQVSSRAGLEDIRHPFFEHHIEPHLDVIAEYTSQLKLIPILLTFDDAHVVSIVPQLIETAVQMLNGVGDDPELDVTPIFQTLYPDWIEKMNQNNPDGATVDLTHLFGCGSASEAAEALMRGEQKEPAVIVHDNITCDMCNTGPIQGARYKCCVCSDFDLCGTCEATGTHNHSHPLLKLTEPCRRVALSDMPGLRELVGRGRNCGWRKWKSEDNRPKAVFIDDANIPDGDTLPPGVVCEKTWRIQNNGSTVWGENCSLVFAAGSHELVAEERFPVRNAAPGEIVDVSTMINTPNASGRYVAHYRLERDGVKFGPRVWVDILVELSAEPEVAEPEPEPEEPQSAIEEPAPEPAAVEVVKNDVLSCMCETEMVRMNHKKAYRVNARINCDLCGKLSRDEDDIYHCPNEFSPFHPEGYDLCVACGDDQISLLRESAVVEEVEVPEVVEDVVETREQEAFPFQDALNMVRQMGFGDEQHIKYLLIKHNGNVEDVLVALLG